MLTNSRAALSCRVCRVTRFCAYESETPCVQHLVDWNWSGIKTGLAFDKAIKRLEAFLSELMGFNRCQNLRASTFLSLSLHPTGSATRLLKAEGRPPNVQHQSQRPCSLKLRCEFSLAPVLCPNLDWAVFQKRSLRLLHINSTELQRETFASELPSALDL